ncbi:MAG: hypothetical protein AAFR61_31930 [Bacteroidota bacterium]
MKPFILSLLLLFAFQATQAQRVKIQVNADGTHTIIHANSDRDIHVQPDGSHKVVFKKKQGPDIQVNPDGTHTLIFNRGDRQLLVRSDGTHIIQDRPAAPLKTITPPRPRKR